MKRRRQRERLPVAEPPLPKPIPPFIAALQAALVANDEAFYTVLQEWREKPATARVIAAARAYRSAAADFEREASDVVRYFNDARELVSHGHRIPSSYIPNPTPAVFALGAAQVALAAYARACDEYRDAYTEET